MKKVFSFNSELYKVTGVQKVLMDVHHAVQGEYDAKIVGTVPFEKVDGNHHISKEEYIHWKKNPFMFYNSIVIIHERKFLAFFWLLNHFLFQRIKIVYVHHNIFHNQRFLSIMPKTVVAIADRGIENLTSFFRVPGENIHKIHNCVKDVHPSQHRTRCLDKVKILYPARINGQKRQVEIVEQLRGMLDSRIKISFVGIGPQFEELKDCIQGAPNFEMLGFRNDIYKLMQEYDYVMLYSVHEGLPITLIEADMLGVPILCSDVGGNSEVCIDKKNGWVIKNWEDLISILNGLPQIDDLQYIQMSRNGRKIYEEKFRFEIFKKKYLDLLAHL